MDILLCDVDMVEELLVDVVIAALLCLGVQRIELVDAVNRYILERNQALLAACCQLAIESQRCASRSKTENEKSLAIVGVVLGNSLGDKVGYITNTFTLYIENRCGNLLITMDDIFGVPDRIKPPSLGNEYLLFIVC